MDVLLPTVTWMKLAGTNLLPSLEPGESTSVNLLLEPPSDLALLIYPGTISIGNGSVAMAVPYQFRAMSTAVGDLFVRATDDYTFYVAGSPKLTNAAVTVTDPFNGRVVTNGVTDAVGEIRFVGLAEGAYTIDVSAPKHNTFRGTATIQAGVESTLEAFLVRQTVTYRWSVVPVEIQDRYRIVLESVFETEVPIPNVIIEEPFMMPIVFEGETNQFELNLRNEGLIAAENVEINVPNHPEWVIVPLVSKIGTIPAKSRLSVPILIHKRPAIALAAFKVASLYGTKAGGGCELDTLPCFPKIGLGVVYSYKCGPNGVEKSVGADLSPICLAKDIKECIENALKAAGSAVALRGGGNAATAACDLIAAILACSGTQLSPCQSAALAIGCGALTGGLAGAAGGAGGGSTLECLCELVKDLNLSLPPSQPGYGQVNYVNGSIIGSSRSGFNGIPWSVGYYIGPGTCASPAGPSPGGPSKVAKTTGGVCARVRIQIEQEAVMTRVAFKGSLEIDNDSSDAISGIRVSLDVRDADENPAGDRFVMRPPTVTGMGNVDGTGQVPALGSGAAEYLFIPTRDAAPTAPTAYRIGGSLRYLDNGQEVVVPLLSSTITVYPEARLQLNYFQSRNVYSDDPFTDEIEPSEPFALGLIAKNIGAGAARNFRITSAQPKIIENEKGLLIDFKIIGSQVGTNAAEPSLTAILGNIPAGQSQVAQWILTSSLQGKFIEYKATFEHIDNFGSTNLSLIDSVEIHELIKPVKADRPGDDLAPDFLVNDVPDPDSLPDALYLSDGTSALVEPLTAGNFSNAIGNGARQTTLAFTAPAGWVYLRLPDPGAGWELYRVTRSDSKALKVGTNVWTTDRTFPSAISGVVRTHEFHLLDHNSTGSYTLFYRPIDEIVPTLVSVGPVTPSFQTAPISQVEVVFSEEIDAATFSAADVSLTLDGGANLAGAGITFTPTATNRFMIGGLASLTGTDGNYELTVNATGIEDFGGNAGLGTLSATWSKGTLSPVIVTLGPVVPNPRNTPLDTIEVTFSRAITAATFTSDDIVLTRGGGANLVTASVQVSQLESNRFLISGLASLTQTAGDYLLTVNAVGVTDTVATAGTGVKTASWSLITSGPQIVSLEHLTTNPRNIVVASLDVTFTAPILAPTLNWQDITLTRNGGANLITSAATVQQVSPTIYRIGNFNWVVGQEGEYTLTISASGITDAAGNVGSGSASEIWKMDTTRPPATTSLALTPDLGISNTDELINSLTPVLSGQLGETNLTVRVKDLTTGVDLGTAVVTGQSFSKLLALDTAGAHQLQVRSVDAAGNTGTPDTLLDVFVDIAQPSAALAPVTPSLRSTPVDTINVTFSEQLNLGTFTRDDLTLRRQGGVNLINTGVQIVNVISNEYQITGLTALTDVAGNYLFTLNMSTVEDRAGNTGTNTLSVSWSRTGSNQ
ncbi:MAG TPA: Ig-like domain-containing protein, partial [Candidatus Acidoferrum sp.]|nr:Ig-like domain-containing protein [Candidatus Acidoferrum sp.]